MDVRRESNSFDNIGTGVGQVSSGIALSIYPNPFKRGDDS